MNDLKSKMKSFSARGFKKVLKEIYELTDPILLREERNKIHENLKLIAKEYYIQEVNMKL